MFVSRLVEVLSATVAVTVVGCGPAVRQGTLSWRGVDGAYPVNPALEDASAIPAEYVWVGGAEVVGGSLRPGEKGGVILDGRVKASSATFLRDSQVVKVEALNKAGRVIWSGLAPITQDHHTRMNRDCCGMFELQIPAMPDLDHVHAGVIDLQDRDRSLPGTCLAGRS